MIEHFDIEELNKAISTFDAKVAEFEKAAFTQMGPPPPPVTQQDPNAAPPQGAPMDPAMAQGGMPPMDPAMAQGGMPPMDPAMMQGGAPMDPAMAQGGMPPMDSAAAQQGGTMGPELEKNLTALFGGVEQMAQVITQQQDQIQTMATRMQQIEQMLDQQNKALESPAGFEGGASSQPAV